MIGEAQLPMELIFPELRSSPRWRSVPFRWRRFRDVVLGPIVLVTSPRVLMWALKIKVPAILGNRPMSSHSYRSAIVVLHIVECSGPCMLLIHQRIQQYFKRVPHHPERRRLPQASLVMEQVISALCLHEVWFFQVRLGDS